MLKFYYYIITLLKVIVLSMVSFGSFIPLVSFLTSGINPFKTNFNNGFIMIPVYFIVLFILSVMLITNLLSVVLNIKSIFEFQNNDYEFSDTNLIKIKNNMKVRFIAGFIEIISIVSTLFWIKFVLEMNLFNFLPIIVLLIAIYVGLAIFNIITRHVIEEEKLFYEY